MHTHGTKENTMFKFNEIATRTVVEMDAEGEEHPIGTEEVQILGVTKVAGEVIVRPLNSEDRIIVHIRHLDEVA
jgi:hypothetical protein